MTLNSSKLAPETADQPLQIENGYVPGFDYTRNWQVPPVKDFNRTLWLGISAESPQAVLQSSAEPLAPGLLVNTSNAGDATGQLNSTTTYSPDTLPDLIAKAAVDTRFGHYEVFGMGRFSPTGSSGCATARSTVGGSAGLRWCRSFRNGLMPVRASWFVGVGGAPSTDEKVFFTSFRYFPFEGGSC